jgi:hypothetical protein
VIELDQFRMTNIKKPVLLGYPWEPYGVFVDSPPVTDTRSFSELFAPQR